MSIATPSNSKPLEFSPKSDSSFDLVEMLLQEQQQLSAVDVFSRKHDDGTAEQVAVEVPAKERPAQERYYQSLLPATAPNPDQQFAFEVDLDSCSGCKACVVACHTLNGLEEDESWRRVGSMTIGAVEADINTIQLEPTSPAEIPAPPSEIAMAHVTTACHHCEDPGCLNGCPVKAYVKDPVTGIVRHLDDQCIGCKYCTMMCPYEVPKYSNRLGIVRKCDMCHNRLSAGEAPACVQSCPNEAIRIRLVNRTLAGEAGADRDKSNSAIAPGAPPSSITLPTTVYTSQRVWDSATPQDIGKDEVAESHWPLAALLVATQISVGMLIWERLAAAAIWLQGGSMPQQATAVVATVSFLVAMVGMNLAPLHLGQPLRAWRVFLGLRTSWLSREAVLLGKYVGALMVAVALLWLPSVIGWLPESIQSITNQWIPDWAAKLTLGLSLPLGVAGLYSSAMIYIATKRPLWISGRTLPRFAATTIVGGLSFLTSCLAIMAWLSNESLLPVGGFIAGFSLLSAGLSSWILATQWKTQLGPTRATDHPHDRRSRRLVRTLLPGYRLARLMSGGLSITLLCLTSALAVLIGVDSILTVGASGLTALVVLLTESTNRLLYFKSVVYDRMPGTL